MTAAGNQQAGASQSSLAPADASRFAQIALANIDREYPCKLDHVIAGPADVVQSRTLHPAFFGSFDWHSCVHAHWLLVRLLKVAPELAGTDAIRSRLDASFAAKRIDAEVEYLRRPEARAFERTYGWAWLLKLAAELASWDDPDGGSWARNLAPLTRAFVDRYLAYLPDATYPIRHGVHANSAFGLAFAIDYAEFAGDTALQELASDCARRWYDGDRNAPADWEPGGSDFFSPTLIEADLMRRVLDQDEFGDWLRHFLPGLERREPATLFTPAIVSDRSDPYIVHLDGLNLSRAWCWQAIAKALPDGDSRAGIAEVAARVHRDAGLVGIASGEYVGEHWLATFAVLALTT